MGCMSLICPGMQALKELNLGELHLPTEGVIDMAVTMAQRGIVKI